MLVALETDLCDDYDEEAIDDIKGILEIGERIRQDEYLNEWHNFFDTNTTPYVHIRTLGKEDKTLPTELERELSREIGEDNLTTITLEETENIEKKSVFESKTYKLLTSKADTWCKEHNYNKGEVTYLFGNEWKDAKCEAKSKKLFDTARKNKEKDVQTFFKMIAEFDSII